MRFFDNFFVIWEFGGSLIFLLTQNTMKKYIRTTLAIIASAILVVVNSSNASGPGGDRTDAPGSSGNCSACHGGTTNLGGDIVVTVIDKSSMRSDGLATAIMVMGPEVGYDFAVAQKMPVFMIIKTETGFSEKYTQQFKPYLLPEAEWPIL